VALDCGTEHRTRMYYCIAIARLGARLGARLRRKLERKQVRNRVCFSGPFCVAYALPLGFIHPKSAQSHRSPKGKLDVGIVLITTLLATLDASDTVVDQTNDVSVSPFTNHNRSA